MIPTNDTTSNPARGVEKMRVLIIDDEPDLRTLYELSLSREGYLVDTAENIEEALRYLQSERYNVVVTDMQLPDGVGLEILNFLNCSVRTERCIVITAHGSAQNAVEALKAGAFDYLTKPVDLKQFRAVLAQAVQSNSQAISLAPAVADSKYITENSSSEKVRPAHEAATISSSAQTALRRIVGESIAMQQVRQRITKVSRSMAPVLIRGESGTGKELVARAIHACSHRSDGPFIAVNCGAIPEHLIEAEFFGARRGAYTGATQDRDGFFQAAHGGTLFLDELGDLPYSMQAKLLRAIQERSVRSLGDTNEQNVNVRIVSATHKDLAFAVQNSQFRQDLFYRINVIEISLPALRERPGDLPLLTQSLLERIAMESGAQVCKPSVRFMEQLQAMPFPGNVRELENLLHRALAMFDGVELSLDESMVNSQAGLSGQAAWAQASDVPLSPDKSAQSLPNDLQAHLDIQEKSILLQALKDTGFNRTLAAARLGINLRQIRYRMSRLGIDVPNEKSS